MALLLPFLLSSAWAAPRLLTVGDEWRVQGAHRVWIESRKVLSAKAAGTAVVIRGEKRGRSEVRVNGVSTEVQVLTPEARETYRFLEKRIAKMAGLELEWDDGFPTITGTLYDLRNYETLIPPAGSAWRFKALVGEKLREEFENAVARKAGPRVAIRPLIFDEAPAVLARGGEAKIAALQKTLERFGIAVIADEHAVEMEPVVRVEIVIAEVSKGRTQSLGVDWPKEFSAQVLPDGTWAPQALQLGAKAFEDKGYGRILARPNLICRSGKEAEFVAGGEIPVKIAKSRHVQDVSWKKYGILLRIVPKADRAGRISLAIETEISAPDSSRSIDNIPAFRTSRVTSHFDLSRSRTIVLSGLLKKEDLESQSGLFGFGSLPIIGSLFSSREWSENRTELVIFVRPEIAKEIQ